MAEYILDKHKEEVAQFALVPADGGRFEVIVDGNLVFSKLQEGRFPSEEEIAAKLD